MSSNDGSIICSRRTAMLSFFKSTQIRTVPFFFTTGTIAEHQSVDYVTTRITSEVTMPSRSAFTLSIRGNGTTLAVVTQDGSTPVFSLIVTGSVFIKPIDASLDEPIWSSRLTRPMLTATSLARRLDVFPDITITSYR